MIYIKWNMYIYIYIVIVYKEKWELMYKDID